MAVITVSHPLVQHKLGLMRGSDKSTRSFRQLVKEVGSLLTYEATSNLELEDYEVEGWCGTIETKRIRGKKITVVPILRAGLGMLRSEEHTSELQSRPHLVCRLLLEKQN